MGSESLFDKSDLEKEARVAIDTYEGRRGCTTRSMRRWFIIASLLTAFFIATALFYDPQYLERLAKRITYPDDGPLAAGSFGKDGKQHVFGFPFYQGAEGETQQAAEELGAISRNDSRGEFMRDGQITRDLGESQAQLNMDTAAASEEGMLNFGQRRPGDAGYQAPVPAQGVSGNAVIPAQFPVNSVANNMVNLAPGEGQMAGNGVGSSNDNSPSLGQAPYVPSANPTFKLPSFGNQDRNMPGQVSSLGVQGQVQGQGQGQQGQLAMNSLSTGQQSYPARSSDSAQSPSVSGFTNVGQGQGQGQGPSQGLPSQNTLQRSQSYSTMQSRMPPTSQFGMQSPMSSPQSAQTQGQAGIQGQGRSSFGQGRVGFGSSQSGLQPSQTSLQSSVQTLGQNLQESIMKQRFPGQMAAQGQGQGSVAQSQGQASMSQGQPSNTAPGNLLRRVLSTR